MTTLLAYHSDPKIKSKYLKRVRAHIKADELVKGTYYKTSGKVQACGVGCTIHSSDHMAYETELGIPVMLARLEDCIFEGADMAWSKQWPKRFLEAIKPGVDLSKVGWKFQHWLLLDPKEGVVRFAREQDKPIFEKVGSLLWDLALVIKIEPAAP